MFPAFSPVSSSRSFAFLIKLFSFFHKLSLVCRGLGLEEIWVQAPVQAKHGSCCGSRERCQDTFRALLRYPGARYWTHYYSHRARWWVGALQNKTKEKRQAERIHHIGVSSQPLRCWRVACFSPELMRLDEKKAVSLLIFASSGVTWCHWRFKMRLLRHLHLSASGWKYVRINTQPSQRWYFSLPDSACLRDVPCPVILIHTGQ